MIRQRDIRKFQARYHRNGVAGEGFYFCQFLFLRGKQTQALHAVVFDEPGRIAVTSPDNISSRWSGDEFEDVIRSALAVMESTRDESLHG